MLTNKARSTAARVAITVIVSAAAFALWSNPTANHIATHTFGSSYGGSSYCAPAVRPVALAPLCFDDTFSSACPSDATFFGSVKGSCCLYPAAGYETLCTPNVFKSTCLNPSRIGASSSVPQLPATFIGSVRGNCCRRVPRPPTPVTPTCFDAFKSACPIGAAYYGTVRGSCCINPARGFHTHCQPDVFKSACVHPDDLFIGTVRGTCCTRVPSAGAM